MINIFGNALSSTLPIFGNNETVNLTARFALLMLVAAFNGFNVRTDNIHLLRGLGRNPLFLLVALIIIFSTIGIVSFGGNLFSVAPLSYKQWLVIFCLAILVIPLDLIRKLLIRK